MKSVTKVTSTLAAVGACALGVGLIVVGTGVGAQFTGSGTANAHIATGTFSCQLSSTDSNVVISNNGLTATVDLGTINSSAQSSKMAPVTVTNTGSISLATSWSETTTGNILGGGEISAIPAAGGIELGASTAQTVNIGFTWSQLQNSDLGRSGTAQYTVDCNEAGSTGNGLKLFSDGTGGTANYANGDVVLGLSDSSATYAGVQVVNPGATLPTTAPTFTTNNYAAGSPRWVIYFSNGDTAFGYPSNAGTGVGNLWSIKNGSYEPYSTVVTTEASETVTEVDILMDADQTPPATNTISCIDYSSSLLGSGTCT